MSRIRFTSAGLDMRESRLIEEEDRAHFMTERFDRIGGNKKLHTQTLCAIAHYDFNQILNPSIATGIAKIATAIAILHVA